MPAAPKLTARKKEETFVSLFVNAGAAEQHLADCARRAQLTVPACRKLLQKKAVQQDIHRRLEPVRLEQMRQSILSEAAQVAKAQAQQELAAKVDVIKRMKIDPQVLEHELMMGVVGLDWHIWPKEKLDVIKAAYVINGVIESSNTRRLIPPETASQESPTGLYTSLFNRLALNPQKSSEALQSAPSAQQEQVFDLIPQPPKPATPASTSLPLADDSIAETPAIPPSNARVITVEID